MADCITPIYLPASFKGVPFEVVSTSDTFGRRGAEYEYPTAEHVNFQDLGRKIRKYKVTGRIVSGLHGPMSNAMVAIAESPGPGLLVHPVFGPVMVACSSLVVGIEYIEKKRYTSLEFEFVEAPLASMAGFSITSVISDVLGAGLGAVAASIVGAVWGVAGAVFNVVATVAGAVSGIITPAMAIASLAISTATAFRLLPVLEENEYDAVDRLNRGLRNLDVYDSFEQTVNPIIEATALIREIHQDAMPRLRALNTVIVEQVEKTPDIESLGVTSRLALVNDFALVSAQYPYTTITEAVNDLDFVMMIYDEEEAVAAAKGDDVLVNAIALARAKSSAAILQNNIQRPGTVTFDAKGVWPSLVAAQIIYQDGSRFIELEGNNPTASPFFMPRTLIGASR
jgi:prophage DNA circulation protein